MAGKSPQLGHGVCSHGGRHACSDAQRTCLYARVCSVSACARGCGCATAREYTCMHVHASTMLTYIYNFTINTDLETDSQTRIHIAHTCVHVNEHTSTVRRSLSRPMTHTSTQRGLTQTHRGKHVQTDTPRLCPPLKAIAEATWPMTTLATSTFSHIL